MSTMKETLGFLASLQEVDKKLFYLEFSKGDLPKTVARLKESLDKLLKQIETLKKSIEKNEIDQRNTENLIETAQEKLKKYQNQLYDVTTNKEYDAITHEIEMKKKEIEEGELSVLNLITENEKHQQTLSALQNDWKQLEKDLEIKEKELKVVINATEKEELELKHHREKLVVRLKEPDLRRYERIRKAKSGIAVVAITRDACGGCFKSIPPQKIVEVEKLIEMIQCDVCGRILIPEAILDHKLVI